MIQYIKIIRRRYVKNIYSIPWKEHFAEVRNFGVHKATKDWILYLDADEIIEEVEPNSLKNLLINTTANIISLPILNYVGEKTVIDDNQTFLLHQTRIFKNNIGITFQNRLHEALCVPDPAMISNIKINFIISR
ncbi:hypothetical protein CN404_28080 [Bacillus thuringiensis]|uniref:glycosyltransferase n=1 Tax=Bacillus thuringiensis TaxID=1428 RepID=UPI000BF694F2|nr:glycosyltransferase [Bacillus thuringiensis]PFB49381.1 hypothetical protein CN404_28080 [Bacillus thuringiensis]